MLRLKRRYLAISLGLYALAMILPATRARAGPVQNATLGIQLFLMGLFYHWMVFFSITLLPAVVAWFANLVYLYGLLEAWGGRFQKGVVLGRWAAGLGCVYLLCHVIWRASPTAFASSGDFYGGEPIIGYYVWLGSMIWLSVVCARLRDATTKPGLTEKGKGWPGSEEIG